MTSDLICTVHPTVSETSPGPDPSAHPPHLWCAWSSRCWRRTLSPPGCPGAYTSVTSEERGNNIKKRMLTCSQGGEFWPDSHTLLPLPACWNPACDPSGTPCFACVQSGDYRPWWTPHVLAWVQPTGNNAREARLLSIINSEENNLLAKTIKPDWNPCKVPENDSVFKPLIPKLYLAIAI